MTGRTRQRLLSVHGMAETGGSDQALLRLVRALPADRFEVHVAVPAPHPLAGDFAAAGAQLHVVPMRRISTGNGLSGWARYALAWPLSVARLALLARRVGADVVHTNSLHFWYGWAAALLVRRPHVWHAREIVVQSPLALRVERWLVRRFADRVVAVSGAVATQLDVPARVVLDLPDAREFSPALAGRFRSGAGVADAAPLVAHLGRIDTWKGLDVLLDAWPAVRAAAPDAVLVVCGEPVRGKEDYAEALRRRAAGLPGVRWLGRRDDVPCVLADADVTVVPSTEPEPFGLVVVEALASGCPVVATDAGGPPEVLALAAPGAGRLVPPRDAARLAEAVLALVPPADRRSTSARAARPRLLEPRTPPYAAIFEELTR